MRREYISNSYEETLSIGQSFAMGLIGGDKISLVGDLGAGKTAFTQGIAKGLGVNDAVASPTFTLLNIYSGAFLELFHFDLYRIEKSDEIYELGLDDYLYRDDGICVVEWNKFEKLKGRVFTVTLNREDDNVRRIIIDESSNN